MRNDLITAAIWYVWWERRQATHGEPDQLPVRSAQAISTLVSNYSRAKKKGGAGIVRNGWQKPRENYVKLNVDAAYAVETTAGGIGGVTRDEKREVTV